MLGFALARAHNLTPPAATGLWSFAAVPVVGLGIVCLVSILAHAVGLFLQQEGLTDGGRSDNGENGDKSSFPALYPGYVLALIAFAVSALAGVVCILVGGVLLLALLAYYRDLWRKPILGPIVLAGSKALAVLVGAAGGGWQGEVFAMPELLLACTAAAVYAWSAETTIHEWPRRGTARWRITLTAGVIGLAVVVTAFRISGVAAMGPWLAAWLAAWLTVRCASLSLAMGKTTGPRMEYAMTRQFQRGELLLLACLVAALLPDWQGTLAFAAVFVLFPVLALLDRR